MTRFFRFLAPLALLLIAAPAFAAGDLVRTSGNPATYYRAEDGKRYVFPNSATYMTWYADFSGVKTVSASELAALPIGGDVTYRPGTRLVKIVTDPKVYAVTRGGVLRHVASEAIAACLYGASWNATVDDVPDAFFTDYRVGASIETCADFDPEGERAASPDISADKGIMPDPAKLSAPTFTFAGGYPADVGTRATLLEIRLSTPVAVEVSRIRVRLSALTDTSSASVNDVDLGGLVRGASERANLTDVRLIDAAGNVVFGSVPLDLSPAKDQEQLLEFGGHWRVAAGESSVLRLVADLDGDIPSGERYLASVPLADISMTDAAGSAARFSPSSGEAVGQVVDVSTPDFQVVAADLADKTIAVRGEKDVPFAAFTIHAGSASGGTVREADFQAYVNASLGSGFVQGADGIDGVVFRASDLLASVRLTDGEGATVAGPVAVAASGRAEFKGLSIAMAARESRTFVLRADASADASYERGDVRVAFDMDDASRDLLLDGAALPASGKTPNGGTMPLRSVTLKKHGTLTAAWNGASGDAVAGRETLLGELKLTAKDDAFTFQDLTLSSVAETRKTLKSLRASYLDADGKAVSASASFMGDDATFRGLGTPVPRDGSASIAVYGTLATPEAGAKEAEEIKVRFSADRAFSFTSKAEGRTFGPGSYDGLGGFALADDVTSAFIVRFTELRATRSGGTPTGTVARASSAEVLRFSISAAPEHEAYLKKLAFRLVPSDAGTAGASNDALERWAEVNGDAADDNGVLELRRLSPTEGWGTIGEGADASIRYSIFHGGVEDATPQGFVSSYADEGQLTIEFTDGSAPAIPAGGSLTFALELKTDAFSLNGDQKTLKVRLLGGPDFLWSDSGHFYLPPVTGTEVAGLPLVSPDLAIAP